MHETSVRAVIPIAGKGDAVLCGLPGLVIGRDGSSYLDPEHADLTFEYLSSLGAVLLYLLMEDFELPPRTRTVLTACADEYGILLKWMPIVDYGCPDKDFEALWMSERADRTDILTLQDSIGVACLYGAGRSGMMAAVLACENGTDPKKAVRYVRSVFPEAVGSPAQEEWIARADFLRDHHEAETP